MTAATLRTLMATATIPARFCRRISRSRPRHEVHSKCRRSLREHRAQRLRRGHLLADDRCGTPNAQPDAQAQRALAAPPPPQ
jgi:hypothetical protein